MNRRKKSWRFATANLHRFCELLSFFFILCRVQTGIPFCVENGRWLIFGSSEVNVKSFNQWFRHKIKELLAYAHTALYNVQCSVFTIHRQMNQTNEKVINYKRMLALALPLSRSFSLSLHFSCRLSMRIFSHCWRANDSIEYRDAKRRCHFNIIFIFISMFVFASVVRSPTWQRRRRKQNDRKM